MSTEFDELLNGITNEGSEETEVTSQVTTEAPTEAPTEVTAEEKPKAKRKAKVVVEDAPAVGADEAEEVYISPATRLEMEAGRAALEKFK